MTRHGNIIQCNAEVHQQCTTVWVVSGLGDSCLTLLLMHSFPCMRSLMSIVIPNIWLRLSNIMRLLSSYHKTVTNTTFDVTSRITNDR